MVRALCLVAAILLPGCKSDKVTTPTDEQPAGRLFHSLLYFPPQQQVVMYGGNTGTPSAEFWSWNGTKWSRIEATGPGPRIEPVLAFDSKRSRMLLFGGLDGNFTGARDLWAWNGQSWTQLSTNGPVLQHVRGGYDPDRDRFVVLGGPTSITLGETWEWDGAAWQRVSTAVPGPLALPTNLTYSPLRHTLLAVAVDFSANTGGTRPAQAWEWNGSAWSVVPGSPPAIEPPGLLLGATAAGDLVLFDLADSSSPIRWNGQQWNVLTVSGTSPARRAGSSGAWDATRQRYVFFGGQSVNGNTYFKDTWEFNGATWTRVAE